MTDWTDIHPDFTDELQKGREQFGLNPEEIKKWIDVGLKPEECDVVFHIESEDYEIEDIREDMELLDELRSQFHEKSQEVIKKKQPKK